MTVLEHPVETGSIRLLLVDDHEMFREGLAGLLSHEAGVAVVGKCGSAAEALDLLASTEPGIILLDFDLAEGRTVDFITEARSRGFAGQILVVTAGVSDQQAVQLIQAGVAGILHKHNSPDALVQAIRRVASNEVCLENNYLKSLFRSLDHSTADKRPELTARDKTILRCVFQGLANKEIGGKLDLSEGAIKASLRQLFQKLGVRTRAQLVKVALELYRDQL